MSAAEGDQALPASLTRAIEQLVEQCGEKERVNITDTITAAYVLGIIDIRDRSAG